MMPNIKEMSLPDELATMGDAYEAEGRPLNKCDVEILLKVADNFKKIKSAVKNAYTALTRPKMLKISSRPGWQGLAKNCVFYRCSVGDDVKLKDCKIYGRIRFALFCLFNNGNPNIPIVTNFYGHLKYLDLTIISDIDAYIEIRAQSNVTLTETTISSFRASGAHSMRGESDEIEPVP